MSTPAYTPELATLIFSRMAEGRSLREVCRADDIPVTETAVRLWAIANRGGTCASQYATARDLQIEAMADQILEISDAGNADVVLDPATGRMIVQGDVVNRARLRVDARKWIMSKIAPKTYGDRVAIHVKTNDPSELTDSELARIATGGSADAAEAEEHPKVAD